MKTSSIIEMLRIKFNHNAPYTENELNKVTTLNIKRFDIDKELLEVNFQDLQYFKELRNLTIDSCVIDNVNLSRILNLKNLKNLILINCTMLDEANINMKKLQINDLVIQGGEINIQFISNLKLNYLFLQGFQINKNISLIADNIDISRCELVDIKSLENTNINQTITISYSQYIKNKNFFDKLNKKIIVMEDNKPFVYKESK